MNSFFKLISENQKNKKTFLCVGLDPNLDLLPKPMTGQPEAVFDFLKNIVDTTEEFACCFKPQIAYFAAYGLENTLMQIIKYIHEKYPQTPVILDAKRNDIGTTSKMYTLEIFNRYKADAVTVNPYMGKDSIEPFIKQKDKGVFVLCRTSNPGAGEFQNQVIEGKPLYSLVAQKALTNWNVHKNIGLVVGATAPEELKNLREECPEAWFLVPGVGAQRGDMNLAIQYGRSEKGGLIISSSRTILYAGKGPDYVEKARKVAQDMQKEMECFF